MKKNAVTKETYFVLIFFILAFLVFSIEMGLANFLGTTIETGYYLLMNVALWIMGVAVLTGAMAGIFSEFGIIALFNKLLKPIVRLAYHLPGVAGIGALSAYLSDNPAVISLYREREFRKQFKDYQIPVLCNLGTSFGMGLVIAIAFMSLGQNYEGNFFLATGVGVFASIIGSIVSVRLLTHYSKKHFKVPKNDNPIKKATGDDLYRYTREGNTLNRLLESALDGGKNGVEIGLQIIPGILIISTFIIILTNQPPVGGYTGGALEGVGWLPAIGKHLMFIFHPLFGFDSPEAIAFPLTSLGSAGAAIGFVDEFLSNGYIDVKDIAVFTAIGTTWSGYLSTHVGIMDSLNSRALTTKAILSHTIGGLVSGITANYLFMLIVWII
jgi:spore maturation protein SpmA